MNWRFIALLIIGIALCFVIGVCAGNTQVYTPLTDSEIADYLARVGQVGMYADLRKLDAIENGTPKVDMPNLIVVYDKSGKMVVFFDKPMTAEFGGYLVMQFTLPKYEREAIKENPWPWAIGGFTLGVIVGGLIVWNLKK